MRIGRRRVERLRRYGITGYQADKLYALVAAAVLSMLFSLTIGSWLGRFNMKLGIDTGNDIQADIFDQIIDADWYAVSRYRVMDGRVAGLNESEKMAMDFQKQKTSGGYNALRTGICAVLARRAGLHGCVCTACFPGD